MDKVGAMEPVRIVVEVGSRGKLVVGEPYFLPGTPIVLDRKSLHGAERGDLAVVTSGRGRAKVERVLGPADRIESVLEGLLVERGARNRSSRSSCASRASTGAPTCAD